MKGDSKVIDFLNSLLTQELSSVDQYVVQAAMFEDWGYGKLHARIAHEADDEREHARRLVHRILFLEGTPDVSSRDALTIGTEPKSMLENDLKYELEVARMLREGIALCREKSDAVSRNLLEELLKDTEEDHIFWLESQLHLIGQVGLERYLSEQL